MSIQDFTVSVKDVLLVIQSEEILATLPLEILLDLLDYWCREVIPSGEFGKSRDERSIVVKCSLRNFIPLPLEEAIKRKLDEDSELEAISAFLLQKDAPNPQSFKNRSEKFDQFMLRYFQERLKVFQLLVSDLEKRLAKE